MSAQRFTLLAGLLLLGLLFLAEPAQAASPNLGVVFPRGAQRGTEVKLRLYGRRLEDPQELLFHGRGIEVLSLKAIKPRPKQDVRVLEARLRIAKDCPLGERALRVRTGSGLSELRTFWVGVLPERFEKEPNGDLARAQVVPLEVTINGTANREDLDLYRFEGKKGQVVTAELVAMRLGHVFFDASLAILDAERFELAKSDDAPFAGQDPVATLALPKDGTYYVAIREAAYRGNGNCRYRLHLGTFPRPSAAIPAGGQPGEQLRLQLFDVNGASVAGLDSAVVTLPKQAGIYNYFARRGEAVAPTPLRLRVGSLPNVAEVEPNQWRKRAQRIPVPSVIHGGLHKAGDVDFYVFSAKKGERFEFRVRGFELGSKTDPVLNVFDHLGPHRAGNDDAGGKPDPVLRFRAPATKDYDLRVRDFLNRGGPGFNYRLEVDRQRPELSVTVNRLGRFGNQDQQIAVAPQGNRGAILLRVRKRGFSAGIGISVAGVSSGVRVYAPDAPNGASVVPVVFEAHANSPLAGRLLEVRATPRGAKAPKLVGSLEHDVELTIGPPNNALYHATRVDRVAFAVTRAAPFSIRVVPTKVPLVRNGQLSLRVEVKRRKGFKGDVRLSMIYDPPGVRSRRNVLVKGKDAAGTMTLQANAKAALGRWPLVVIARTSQGGGNLWTSSLPLHVSIEQPFVSMAFEKSSAELGAKTELCCRVKVLRPFPGNARARLYRLPGHAKSKDLVLTKGSAELRFPVAVASKGRAGRFRGIFCQVVIPFAGGEVTQNAGSTELRVDTPRPKSKTKPKAKPKAKPKPKPKAKAKRPLSRIERLREEHRRKVAEEAKP